MEWEGSSPYSPEFKSLFTFDLALEPSRVWRSRLYNAICNRYLTILVPYHFGPYHFGWQNCGGHQFLQYHQCSFSPTRLVNNMHCHQNLLPVTCIVIKISQQHSFEKNLMWNDWTQACFDCRHMLEINSSWTACVV